MPSTEIKTRDVRSAWEPFGRLAFQIQKKHARKLFFKWLKEEHAPRCDKFEANDPELYRAIKGSTRTYWFFNGEYFSEGLSGDYPAVEVSMEKLMPYASDEVREELAQGEKLKDKAKALQVELEAFLEGFSSWEQAIFSLPELKNFAPTKAVSQKRPRFVKVPTNELRRLIQEAVRLKEAGV